MTKCTKCKKIKPDKEFQPEERKKNGLHSWCRECMNEMHRTRHVVRQATDKSYKKRRDLFQRAYHVKVNIDVYIKTWDALLKAQDSRCAICGRHISEVSFVMDHCHHTGKIRGLLCGRCNTGLGAFQDDPSQLQIAVGYLKQI